jgi:PAS domain-containing protein
MVFHDITERRRAEQRLENSEVRYRRLFEAAHDGILILETDECRITDVNPFIMTLLDYPASISSARSFGRSAFSRTRRPVRRPCGSCARKDGSATRTYPWKTATDDGMQ